MSKVLRGSADTESPAPQASPFTSSEPPPQHIVIHIEPSLSARPKIGVLVQGIDDLCARLNLALRFSVLPS